MRTLPTTCTPSLRPGAATGRGTASTLAPDVHDSSIKLAGQTHRLLRTRGAPCAAAGAEGDGEAGGGAAGGQAAAGRARAGIGACCGRVGDDLRVGAGDGRPEEGHREGAAGTDRGGGVRLTADLHMSGEWCHSEGRPARPDGGMVWTCLWDERPEAGLGGPQLLHARTMPAGTAVLLLLLAWEQGVLHAEQGHAVGPAEALQGVAHCHGDGAARRAAACAGDAPAHGDIAWGAHRTHLLFATPSAMCGPGLRAVSLLLWRWASAVMRPHQEKAWPSIGMHTATA